MFYSSNGLYTVCQKSSVNPIKKQKIQIFFIALQNNRHPLQHTFDNVHTASGNNKQRPPVESIAEWLSRDLWWHSRPKNVILWWPPSSGETGRSPQEPTQGVRRVIKHSYHLLSQKLPHTDRTGVQGHYRGAASIFLSCGTLAEPAGYAVALGSNLLCCINGLNCRNKFLMNDVFVVE